MTSKTRRARRRTRPDSGREGRTPTGMGAPYVIWYTVVNSMTTRPSPTRLAGKELTRQALVRAALKLLSDNSFDSLSLREVTREAGITPTAFYRHYDDMEEPGLVLAEESFQSLGDMLKDARSREIMDGEVITRSLAVVVLHMHHHTAHFRF